MGVRGEREREKSPKKSSPAIFGSGFAGTQKIINTIIHHTVPKGNEARGNKRIKNKDESQ